jgi:hypothetical protein
MLGGLALAAVVAAPLSSASAHCYYRHCHRYYGGPVGAVFGLAGAVVVTAAQIATAPLVIAGHVLAGPDYGPAGYDGGEYRYSYAADGFYRTHYYGPRRYWRRYDRPYRYVDGE